MLMAGIKADFLPQKAGADADIYFAIILFF